MSIRSKLSLILFTFVFATTAMAEDADNTVKNDRERSKAEKTPVDQNENKRDIEITRKLRTWIVADKSLSTYAHNVKIITQSGVVNLKGPVRTADEKSTIERLAGEAAGTTNVKSQLEIAPDTAIDTSANDNRNVKKPDNSEFNRRERNQNEKTPIDQNENKSDLEITRQIRKAIVADKDLSTYAHNIKIITQNGVVNLKGPVRTAEEKASVESKAASVAGQGKVESQIDVAPKDAK